MLVLGLLVDIESSERSSFDETKSKLFFVAQLSGLVSQNHLLMSLLAAHIQHKPVKKKKWDIQEYKSFEKAHRCPPFLQMADALANAGPACYVFLTIRCNILVLLWSRLLIFIPLKQLQFSSLNADLQPAPEDN